MKRKKLSEQHCDKIIQKYKAGTGYGRISRLLRIPESTVRAVVCKWKRRGGFAHLQAAGDAVNIHAKTASVTETPEQSEERVDGRESGLGKKEQRIVPSPSRCGESRVEDWNRGGRVHRAKRIHSCEIVGAVIAARGKKGCVQKDKNYSGLNPWIHTGLLRPGQPLVHCPSSPAYFLQCSFSLFVSLDATIICHKNCI